MNVNEQKYDFSQTSRQTVKTHSIEYLPEMVVAYSYYTQDDQAIYEKSLVNERADKKRAEKLVSTCQGSVENQSCDMENPEKEKRVGNIGNWEREEREVSK